MKNHILSVLVENKPAVLARVIGLVSGRGYNIETLNVAPTCDATTSRITMTVPGDDHVLEQVTKQLNKLVDVIKVYDLAEGAYVDRELALVKVAATPRNRAALIELAALFRGEVVSAQSKALVIQVVGPTETVDAFLEMIKPCGIAEASRTGVMAMGKRDA